MAETKFCMQCGKQLNVENPTFCIFCGARLKPPTFAEKLRSAGQSVKKTILGMGAGAGNAAPQPTRQSPPVTQPVQPPQPPPTPAVPKLPAEPTQVPFVPNITRYAVNSRVVDLYIQNYLGSKTSFLTQSPHSVSEYLFQSGRVFYEELGKRLDDHGYVRAMSAAVEKICAAAVEFIGKDFDAVYHDLTFEGWKIESLSRVDLADRETVYLDYCLSRDGKLFFLVFDPTSDTYPAVAEVVWVSPVNLQSPFCNVYLTTAAGVLGALDLIPIDPNDPQRRMELEVNDESLLFNFPVQIDNTEPFEARLFEGAVRRVANLLAEDEKAQCIEKYPWIAKFFADDPGCLLTAETVLTIPGCFPY